MASFNGKTVFLKEALNISCQRFRTVDNLTLRSGAGALSFSGD